MATETEILNRLLSLESQFASFLAGTITMSQLTQAQRRTFIEEIFESGVLINAEDPQVKADDDIYGEGFENVNGGTFFVGKAIVDGPFTKTGAGAAVEDTDITVKFG